MVEGETSKLLSPADSLPPMETVSPREELKGGLKEVTELNFLNDDISALESKGPVELEDPNDFEDVISQGTKDITSAILLQPGDVGM
jgi:hypothetical protein